jgi:hypothetical protein
MEHQVDAVPAHRTDRNFPDGPFVTGFQDRADSGKSTPAVFSVDGWGEWNHCRVVCPTAQRIIPF